MYLRGRLVARNGELLEPYTGKYVTADTKEPIDF